MIGRSLGNHWSPGCGDGQCESVCNFIPPWFALVLIFAGQAEPAWAATPNSGVLPGVLYTNQQIAEVPWSIHVVRVERTNAAYRIHLRHAGGGALGLSTLRDQIANLTPVAAINGGFYQRDKAYAGAGRGVQVMDGELLSAPASGDSFWIDALNQPRLGNLSAQHVITWPDGRRTPFGLNGDRGTNDVELYTPAIGTSTLTTNGGELILERQPGSRWLPLRIGQNYSARVREVRHGGNTPLATDVMVVSLNPELMTQFQHVKPGDVLQISTASLPALHGIRTALSGGPVLVRNGRRQKLRTSDEESYEFSSMLERHPRSAIGWNKNWFFLVVVDGRQPDLSEGMTIEELSDYLVKLGCDEALNLDGGGSSTLWFDGDVRNSPCDHYERTIANSLMIVRKKTEPGNPPAHSLEAESPETGSNAN